MKIKKGDTVIILAGKDRGKSGKVLRVLPEKGKVLVEGINMFKKHQRPSRSNQRGQVVDMAMPIQVSNVALIDPKSGKATRAGYRIEGGKKVRIARRSGEPIA